MSRSISTVALLLGLCLVSCAQRPDPAPAPQRLRVVTYNIHHSRGVDGRVDTARIAALLGRIGADVVGLQEVDRGVRRTQGRDLARELATQLGMHFAFGKNLDYQGGDYGNALLSRFPIVRAENRHYDMLRVGEQRGVLDATLSVYGRALRVLVTHIDYRPDPTERLANLAQLARWCSPAQDDTPLLLMGDFNDVPGAAVHTLAAASWRDAWAEVGVGDGSSYPSGEPVKRIDWILYREDPRLQPMRAWTLRSAASDHLPVVLDCRLR